MAHLAPLPLTPLPDPIYLRLEWMSPSRRADVVIEDIPVTFLDVLCAAREYAPVHAKHGFSLDCAVLFGIAHCLATRGYTPTPYRIHRFVDAIKDVPWTMRASA